LRNDDHHGIPKWAVIDTLVILTPEDALAATLESLPPLERTVVTAHYLDGVSVLRISQRLNVKQADIRDAMSSGLAIMQNVLRWRGIRGLSDVI
jgi:DNA-directed RNA polymerase specialized sigma24 family protein